MFNHSEGIGLEECTRQYKVHLKVEKAQKKAKSDVWTVPSAGSNKKDSQWVEREREGGREEREGEGGRERGGKERRERGGGGREEREGGEGEREEGGESGGGRERGEGGREGEGGRGGGGERD